MEKIVVIGSNSFSGAHFIDYLLEINPLLENTINQDRFQIIGISRSHEKKDIYLPYKKKDLTNFSFHQLDLNDNFEEIKSLLDELKPEYIVNFASQSMVGQSWDNPDHWYKTNVLSIVKLTNWLKDKTWLKKYLHTSTPEVYGSMSGSVTENHPYNPSSPYAGSRAAADDFIQMLIKEFNFPGVFTRAANVYGPSQQLFKIIPRSIVYSKSGKKVPLHGGGEARRAFIHIMDVCVATLKILLNSKPGEIYHLSTKELISIKDLVGLIASKLGRSLEDVSEVVGTRRGLDDAYILDSSKAINELSWQPAINLNDGIKETVDWVNNNWETISDEPLEYIHQK